MSPRPTSRRLVEVTGLLGTLFVVTALGRVQRNEVYREDERAIPVASIPAAPGFEFAASEAFVERAVEGDSVRLTAKDGSSLRIRGPVTFASGATTAQRGELQFVAWDEYGGDVEAGGSFDVLGAFVENGEVQKPFVIAGGPAFQARPSVALTPDGQVWIAWEEGPDGWGGTYRSVDQQWNNATDSHGPLHTWRATRLAQIGRDGSVTEIEVPMPSFELQRLQPERRPGAERIGVFYERPAIASDPEGGLWLAYRHVHQREAGLQIPKLTTHVERGFSVYARRLVDGQFGPVLRIDERQRDGEQPMEFRTAGSGLELILETGRADRRNDAQFKGVRVAALPADSSHGDLIPASSSPIRAAIPAAAPEVRKPARASADVKGSAYSLYFGDLHRHTDLSLCFPFFDGSLDDAYRYAMGPGALDFVAVTDHARDLDQGKSASRPWQLHVAAADRYHQPGRFIAFRAYERSQGDTDHNIIGLQQDADFLRPHRPPLTEFWDEFPADAVLSIPHATAARPGQRFCGNVWTKRDDLKRPIAEIYQAFRDVSSMEELQTRALMTGQKLGFIASSDHLATSSSYACVWNPGTAEEPASRESLFRSLQARRCYGATARIDLRVTATAAQAASQTFWMGEDLPDAASFQIQVSGTGSGPVERIEYWSDGKLVHSTNAERVAAFGDEFRWSPAAESQQYLFVRIVQADGEQAWSSPFFVRWETKTTGTK